MTFRKQDLRTPSLGAAFDAVICLWTSIGYFSDQDNDRMLLGLANAVSPGGVLILELNPAENAFRHFEPEGWCWWGEGPDRMRVLEERRWDGIAGRIEVTWTFQRQGHEESRETSIRIYTCAELVTQLRRAGFTRFEATDPSGAPFGIGRRLWLEARKA